MKKNLKNEDDFKIEDDLKKKMLNSRQSPALAYMNRVIIVFTSFVAYSCMYYMRSLYCLLANVAQITYSVLNTYSNVFVKDNEYRIYL